MMTKWRPEGWENNWRHIGEIPIVTHQAYEAGADAMLDAIWKLAEESPTKTFTFDASCLAHIYEGTFYARN